MPVKTLKPETPKTETGGKPARRRARRARPAVDAGTAAPPTTGAAEDPVTLDAVVYTVVRAVTGRFLFGESTQWRDLLCRCPKAEGAIRACSGNSYGDGLWRSCPRYLAAPAAEQRAPVISAEWLAVARACEKERQAWFRDCADEAWRVVYPSAVMEGLFGDSRNAPAAPGPEEIRVMRRRFREQARETTRAAK